MSLFRDVSLPYAGRDYTFTPSNRVLRLIETKAKRDVPSFHLARFMYELSTGLSSYPDTAFVLAEFVNASGGKTNEDEALAYITSIDADTLRQLTQIMIGCAMPEVKEKKPEAPAA